MTSWKSASDPSIGNFSLSLGGLNIPEVFIRNGDLLYWRSGPWNGSSFIGVPGMNSLYMDGYNMGNEEDGTAYLTFLTAKGTDFVTIVLNSHGRLEQTRYVDKKIDHKCTVQNSDCDVYGKCELDGEKKQTVKIVIIATIGTISTVAVCACVLWTWTAKDRGSWFWDCSESLRNKRRKALYMISRGKIYPKIQSGKMIGDLKEVKLQELPLFSFGKLATATNNFHLSNKLGEGGFGSVYKGILQDGQEIAAWKLWKEDNTSSLVDLEILDDEGSGKDILRCIHIGLLCVQELARNRPTMATVVSMLNSEIVNLPSPGQPAFVQREVMLNSQSSMENQSSHSTNNVTVTNIIGR
ncbi:hypothetical protein L6164_032733 [Bauhinia variegata]|uniref:Uncharacterized protein n=1 Tax=Bauhinia variegata TaxID=167791 RepID=A0ACB9KPR1_BAUVA|nr:hypothetical protein L6164_032733 [Bauhinia variegata]